MEVSQDSKCTEVHIVMPHSTQKALKLFPSGQQHCLRFQRSLLPRPSLPEYGVETFFWPLIAVLYLKCAACNIMQHTRPPQWSGSANNKAVDTSGNSIVAASEASRELKLTRYKLVQTTQTQLVIYYIILLMDCMNCFFYWKVDMLFALPKLSMVRRGNPSFLAFWMTWHPNVIDQILQDANSLVWTSIEYTE